MVELKNVCKTYSQGEQSVTALSGINLNFGVCGFVSIVGESGCGKTTLLNMLAGFDEVCDGAIYFGDRKLDIANEDKMIDYYRDDVGFVFQNYNVLEQLTVWENVELPLSLLCIDKEEKESIINATLKKIGLHDVRDKKVIDLSGGQKQRVAVARAYVKKPKVILADEPTGNLDYDNGLNIFEMLKDISSEILVIVVTHDKNMACKYSDRIITMSNGKVLDDRELSKNDYNLKISNKICEEYIDDYSQLINYIQRHSCDDDQYILRVEKKECNEEKDVVKAVKKKQYEPVALSTDKVLKLSNKILAKRKKRQILLMAIFTITISLLLLVLNIGFYDKNRIVEAYLDKYNENKVVVEMKLKGLSKYSKETNTAYVSREIRKCLTNIEGGQLFSQFLGIEFSNHRKIIEYGKENKEDDFSINVDMCVFTQETLQEKYLIDKLEKNEIVITKSLAKEINLSEKDIDKKFYINEDEVVLKYIVDGVDSEIYTSQSYIEYIKQKKAERLSIRGDFIKSKSLFEYVNSSIVVCNIAGETDDNVRKLLDESDNTKVIVSYSFLNDHMDMLMEEVVGKTYSLIDIYKEEYGNAFSENMNLYDYLGTEITVVGVAEFEGDIYVTEKIYNEIVNDYYDIFVYDRLGIYSSDWEKIVSELHNRNLRISDENLNDVYAIADVKQSAIKYILLVMIVMVLLTSFTMIGLIGYSINDNSKIIGILKSLGVNKVDIKKIFMIQPIKIIAIAFFMALISLYLLVQYVNVEYCRNIIGRAYDIVSFDMHAVVGAFVFVLIMGVFTVMCPLKEMDKKTIIDNMKY